MNKIFNPSLVISVGPSAKKALTLLDNMLLDIPKYLRDVIELYDIDSLEECEKNLQDVIDNKLLSAKRLNKLVDLGYKIRSENTANIKLNIYVYWDLYDTDFPIKDLIETLYKLNYCVVDKTKHSGVSLFLLPILEREWLYDDEKIKSSIGLLKDVVDILSIQDNMIKLDSKVYITHPVSNDGLRVQKEELEYLCAIITYLTILPSQMPPLSIYNKRLLKSEVNFKLGTIGISTLTVFKDRVKEEFKGYLINDLVDHALNYEKLNDFSNYSSNRYLDNRNTISKLSEGLNEFENSEVAFSDENLDSLNENILEESMWNRNVEEYAKALSTWEEAIRSNYNNVIKSTVDKNVDKYFEDSKDVIEKDLNTVILNYGLKDGEKFLHYIKEKNIKNLEKANINKNKERSKLKKINDNIKDIANNYSTLKGFTLKGALIIAFVIYSLNNILSKVAFIEPVLKYLIISIIATITMIIFLAVYYYEDKKLMINVNNYIEEVSKNRALLLSNTISSRTIAYCEEISKYIDEKIKDVYMCMDNFKKLKVDVNEFKIRDDEEVENIVTDLLNYEDRRKFYEEKRNDIDSIYISFIQQHTNYRYLKDEILEENIMKFSNDIAEKYTNIDFYDYIKIKWPNDSDERLGVWIENAAIKSKELLQFNQDYNLEEHKLLMASKNSINSAFDSINKNLKSYSVVSLEEKDISLNSISLIRISIGIELDKITPFRNIGGGMSK